MEVYKSLIRGVLGVLKGHYIELSKQKYSSNVVEKSIVNSAQLDEKGIFEELLQVSAVMQLLENYFGVFVLQKTLQALTEEEVKRMDEEVRAECPVGLLSKWKMIVNKVM